MNDTTFHGDGKVAYVPVVVNAKLSKPITNADRIRSMTDEELTVFLSHLTGCVDCIARREDCGYDCRKAWADWLREEAVSDG